MIYSEVVDNYKRISDKIENARIKAGRTDKIRLMAVTKTVDVQKINFAISQGIDLVGENRVQELLSKYDEMDKTAEIHLIGTLQTNKVKYICDKVSMIQSVDSIKLATEINKRCEKISKVMDVLLEVNIGREESKGGFSPEQLNSAIGELLSLPNIRLRGLMTIPPFGESEKYFPEMYKLYVDNSVKKVDNRSNDNFKWDTLSMGMSDDFEEAIQNGANIVRIGSALFGKRIY